MCWKIMGAFLYLYKIHVPILHREKIMAKGKVFQLGYEYQNNMELILKHNL